MLVTQKMPLGATRMQICQRQKTIREKNTVTERNRIAVVSLEIRHEIDMTVSSTLWFLMSSPFSGERRVEIIKNFQR
jgi:hypothetical protein